MKIGLRLPHTGKNRATTGNIIHLAQEVEDAGFDSLWVLERLIWPDIQQIDDGIEIRDSHLKQIKILMSLKSLSCISTHSITLQQ